MKKWIHEYRSTKRSLKYMAAWELTKVRRSAALAQVERDHRHNLRRIADGVLALDSEYIATSDVLAIINNTTRG
jgi:hypothetical protein